MFQFRKGAIKGIVGKPAAKVTSLFQFRKGAIKGQLFF